MTEIEDTLSRVLAAEADRHEPPVFNAHRIAEAATARRRFWRRPLFALVAGVIAAAGAGVGGAVVAAGGGQHRLADPVTVTIQSPAGSAGPQSSDGAVKAWVGRRAAAEGLKDVTATVKHNPWRLEVTGHAGDLDLLKSFSEPGILQLRPTAVISPPEVPAEGPNPPCAVSTVRSGDPWPACGRDGGTPAWVTDPVGIDYHVVAARTMLFSPNGPTWGVVVTFDAAGQRAYAGLDAPPPGHETAVMIDGSVAQTMGVGASIGGMLGFAAGSTSQQAGLLAEILATQGFPGLEGATVTVSTR